MAEVKKQKERIGKILLPIVAKSLFIKDFDLQNDNTVTQDYYYKEQCAIKHLFGVNGTIKFI